jgi:hypothetical protein
MEETTENPTTKENPHQPILPIDKIKKFVNLKLRKEFNPFIKLFSKPSEFFIFVV